jgi:signal transduction histidine kinase
MTDVTAQRETEAQLRQAQKMETVGTLAGGVAHDFNNQLTGVIGHLDLLERSLGAGDERAEHARIARIAAERCAELTRGLLAFSRRCTAGHSGVAQRGRAESVQLLRRVLPATSRRAGPDRPPSVDITQIQQVLFNLCINARDAMPAGGRLVLRTERVTVTEGDRRHPDSYAGDFVRLEVRDTAEAIPAEAMARIFEPFFTTKPVGEGTGLGLSMAYGIVSKHSGWIECRREAGLLLRVHFRARPRRPRTASRSGPPRARAASWCWSWTTSPCCASSRSAPWRTPGTA